MAYSPATPAPTMTASKSAFGFERNGLAASSGIIRLLVAPEQSDPLAGHVGNFGPRHYTGDSGGRVPP